MIYKKYFSLYVVPDINSKIIASDVKRAFKKLKGRDIENFVWFHKEMRPPKYFASHLHQGGRWFEVGEKTDRDMLHDRVYMHGGSGVMVKCEFCMGDDWDVIYQSTIQQIAEVSAIKEKEIIVPDNVLNRDTAHLCRQGYQEVEDVEGVRKILREMMESRWCDSRRVENVIHERKERTPPIPVGRAVYKLRDGTAWFYL